MDLRDTFRDRPDLAARWLVMCLPAALVRLPPLTARLVVPDVGEWHLDSRARSVRPYSGERVDFSLRTSPEFLLEIMGGSVPKSAVKGLRVEGRGAHKTWHLRRLIGYRPDFAGSLRLGGPLDLPAVGETMRLLDIEMGLVVDGLVVCEGPSTLETGEEPVRGWIEGTVTTDALIAVSDVVGDPRPSLDRLEALLAGVGGS